MGRSGGHNVAAVAERGAGQGLLGRCDRCQCLTSPSKPYRKEVQAKAF